MDRIKLRACRFAGAAALVVALGAAAPNDMKVLPGDVAPLGQSTADAASAAPTNAAQPAKVLTFQNTLYQAAPVPNPDVEAPPGAVQTDAQIGPRFLSPPLLFQGDGYSYASSQQATLDRRKAAAPGLGLSVPVDQ